jgi:hypothetical protein
LTLSLHDHLALPHGLTTPRVAAADHALGAQGTVHLRLDVPRLSGDRRLDASALDAQCVASPGRADARDCRAVVPLAGLGAGRYAIEFTATRAGSDPVVRAVGFEVR